MKSQYMEGLHLNKFTLLNHMPAKYLLSKVTNETMRVASDELDTIESNNKYIENQLLINTATEDLKRYEKELGIRTNSDKTIAERRAIIQAKQLSTSTSTRERIEAVCKSFVDNAEVIEHNSEGYFEVNIILNGELPYTLDSLYSAVDEIQPAHLEAVYNLVTINNGNIYVGSVIVSQETTTVYPQEVIE